MQTPDFTQLGAIFDWDGVIIDSSAQHEESWMRLAAEEGKPLPHGHFKEGFGRRNEWIIPNIIGWTDAPAEIQRLSLRKEQLYREIVIERGIEPLPGIHGLLAALVAAGIPCAVGSSTHRKNIETILHLIGEEGVFRTIVTAEDVSHGKPDPEVFLACAARIDRPAARCVVFEDAHVGIEAARRAGMKVVAVATTHPISDLGAADLAVPSLENIMPATLLALVKESVAG